MAQQTTLYVDQGSAYDQSFEYFLAGTESNATPPGPTPAYDFTGASAKMQMREQPGAPVLLELDSTPSASGQLLLGGPAGTIEIKMTSAATASLSPYGATLYDISVIFPDGHATRVMQGSVTVSAAITAP